MIKNVLITGGTGFIGGNLYSYLKSRSYNVFLLVRNSNLKNIGKKKKNIILWEELFNKEKVLDIYGNDIPKIDVVIHLASYGVNPVEDSLEKMMDVNINLTLKLLKNMFKLNCKKIIFTGTALEYKYKTEKLVESDEIHGNTYYSATKSSGLLLAECIANKLEIDAITLRVFNIFGEKEKDNKLLPSLFKNKDEKYIPFSKGEQIKDFLYIKDLLLAYEKVLIKDIFDNGIYNVCSGKGISVKEFIILASKVANIPFSSLKFGEYEYRIGEPMYIVGNNEKFSSKFEWSPKYKLEEGIKLVYQEYQKEFK